MSRTCHSVIYTFVPAGGRDRSPFPFYVSLKLSGHTVFQYERRGGGAFSLSEIERRKGKKKKEKVATYVLRGYILKDKTSQGCREWKDSIIGRISKPSLRQDAPSVSS